jgi:hypothetical protein
MQACKEYMIRACFAAVSFSKKADLSASIKKLQKKRRIVENLEVTSNQFIFIFSTTVVNPRTHPYPHH